MTLYCIIDDAYLQWLKKHSIHHMPLVVDLLMRLWIPVLKSCQPTFDSS